MSHSERDPRTDPRPGDVLEVEISGRTTLATVTAAGYGYVAFETTEEGLWSDFRLEEWRRWIAGARVVARGAGGGG